MSDVETMKITYIPLKDIHVNENFNCRGAIAPIDVVDMIKSIEADGLIQPVAVRRYDEKQRKLFGYEFGLIAGFRRTTAFKVMKRDKIPCIVHEGITDVSARVINLKENLARKDLNILQEAKSIEQFKAMGFSRQWIAEQTGQSLGWVQTRVMLLDLPSDIQECAAAGILNQAHIRDLYTIKDPNKRIEAVKAIKNAKARGEGTAIITKALVRTGSTMKQRTRTEMFLLQDEIVKVTGHNILTRLLGWTGGVVNDYDWYLDLQTYIRDVYGIEYVIPENFRK
jgi:ParB/RepB/Spo0J family partition protein